MIFCKTHESISNGRVGGNPARDNKTGGFKLWVALFVGINRAAAAVCQNITDSGFKAVGKGGDVVFFQRAFGQVLHMCACCCFQARKRKIAVFAAFHRCR